MTTATRKIINRFRKAYPELSDYSNYEVMRMLNSDRKTKRLVDKRLKEKIGGIDIDRAYC